MCGFVGVLGSNAHGKLAFLDRAAPFVRRRGPDSEGICNLGKYGWLFASRLAFQDPRPVANQPFQIESPRATLAYNGEAFNIGELSAYLPSSIPLHTISDTEVIARLLVHRGARALEKVDGPYALALYEEQSGVLTLARDPLGRKPLYYSVHDGALIFGSDARSVSQVIGASQTLSENALTAYLHLGFLGSSESGFSDVRSVPAGGILRWTVSQGFDASSTFVTTPVPRFHQSRQIQVHHPRQIRRAVLDATLVRSGDERSALSLSGGIDSTALLLAAKELETDTVPYSIYWPNADKTRYSNDGHAASLTAKRLGFPIRLIEGANPSEVPDLLRKLTALLSGPNANPTSLTQLQLQTAIRADGIRVTLTGDGADEIFLGYPRYLRIHDQRHLITSGGLANLAFTRAPKSDRTLRGAMWVGRSLAPTGNALSQLSWHQLFSPGEIRKLTGRFPDLQHWRRQVDATRDAVPSEVKGESPVAQQAIWDRFTWLAHESNPVADAVSMGLGGEIRCPFQSRHLIQVLADGGVPIDDQIGKKLLLRSAFPELSQTAALNSKQGFISPVGHWLRGNVTEVETAVRSLPALVAVEEKPVLELLGRWRTKPWTGDLRRMWALWALAVWLDAPLQMDGVRSSGINRRLS